MRANNNYIGGCVPRQPRVPTIRQYSRDTINDNITLKVGGKRWPWLCRICVVKGWFLLKTVHFNTFQRFLIKKFLPFVDASIVCGTGNGRASDRTSLCLPVPAIDSSAGVRRVCCWASCGQEISIDSCGRAVGADLCRAARGSPCSGRRCACAAQQQMRGIITLTLTADNNNRLVSC